MSLTVAEIRNADLAGLSRAVEHRRRMAVMLRQLDEEFDASVVRVVGENWAGGFTSGLAYHDLRVSNRQLSDAVIEAEALANELEHAFHMFTGAKKSLQMALDEIAAEGMTWTATVFGQTMVSWPEGKALGPAMSDHALEYKQRKEATAKRLADQLATAVSAAEAADTAAAQSLTRATGGSDETFNANPKADPYADTQRASDLLKKAPGLSKAELAELQRLLEANDGNDLFAESVLRTIGPAKLLDVTAAFDDKTVAVVANMVNALGVNPPQDLPAQLQPAVTKVLA